MPEPIQDTERDEIREFITEHWHAPHICIRDKMYHPHLAEAFIERRDGKVAALVTYEQQGDAILMITQNSIESGAGIGASLVLKVIEEARKRKVRRIWLTTTNDNLKSIGFYQRMGFRMVAIHRDAVVGGRRSLKPELPEFGVNGLPILDEIEMELILQPAL